MNDDTIDAEQPERRPEPLFAGLYEPPRVERLGAFADLTGGNGGEVHADDGTGPSHYYTN
jgi:hypothetical protein